VVTATVTAVAAAVAAAVVTTTRPGGFRTWRGARGRGAFHPLCWTLPHYRRALHPLRGALANDWRADAYRFRSGAAETTVASVDIRLLLHEVIISAIDSRAGGHHVLLSAVLLILTPIGLSLWSLILRLRPILGLHLITRRRATRFPKASPSALRTAVIDGRLRAGRRRRRSIDTGRSALRRFPESSPVTTLRFLAVYLRVALWANLRLACLRQRPRRSLAKSRSSASRIDESIASLLDIPALLLERNPLHLSRLTPADEPLIVGSSRHSRTAHFPIR
jgi:hypothetical protein